MFDSIIIGAGPGGLAASIYIRRSNLSVAIVEGSMPGGQLANTAIVENYPGYESIPGADLAMKMYMQATNLGAEYISEFATMVDKNEAGFEVTLKSGKKLKSKTIIVSTGMKHRKLHVPGEEQFDGKGVSWCAICDGNLYRNKDVAVVGGGNSAVDESMYLSGIVNKVYLIHRRDKFRADNILVDKIKKIDNIEIVLNDEIEEIIGGEGLEKLKLKSGRELDVEGLFEYIGFLPSSELISHFNITDKTGFIEVDENYETKVKGLYAVGDIVKKEVRQIVTAVGDGAIAALHAVKCCR